MGQGVSSNSRKLVYDGSLYENEQARIPFVWQYSFRIQGISINNGAGGVAVSERLVHLSLYLESEGAPKFIWRVTLPVANSPCSDLPLGGWGLQDTLIAGDWGGRRGRAQDLGTTVPANPSYLIAKDLLKFATPASFFPIHRPRQCPDQVMHPHSCLRVFEAAARQRS